MSDSTRHLGRIEKIKNSKAWRWLCDWIEHNREQIAESKRCAALQKIIDLQADQIREYEHAVSSLQSQVEQLQREDAESSTQIERLRFEIGLLQDELQYSAKVIARDRERIDAESSIYATIKTDHVAKYRPSDIGRVKDDVMYGDD